MDQISQNQSMENSCALASFPPLHVTDAQVHHTLGYTFNQNNKTSSEALKHIINNIILLYLILNIAIKYEFSIKSKIMYTIMYA